MPRKGSATWALRSEGLKANFCPTTCGTLLDLPTPGGIVKCPLCNFSCRVSQLSAVASTTSSKRAQVSGATEPGQQVEDRPKVNEICEKCNNNEQYFSTVQLRSADEGQTIFYECTKCGHRTTLNS